MYKFRLTLSHETPGFFSLDCNAFGYKLAREIGLELFPRDSEHLLSATRYHIDGSEFKSEFDAITAGEDLRKRLRLINCILDLGLTIPTEDKVTGGAGEVVKDTAKQHGGVLLDTRDGLSVIVDDGLHVELIPSGKLRVVPSDPIFLFDAVKDIWGMDFRFDARAEEVIELLNLSSAEKSDKLKFLLTYLALEQLIAIKDRSEDAQSLIKSFIKLTNDSDIPDDEKNSIVGSLSNLTRGSFSGALSSFAKRIKTPNEIQGYTPKQLASLAIGLRNKIAHKLEITKDTDIGRVTKGIRELTFRILWSEYNLPSISINRPADSVHFDKFEFKVL